MKSTKVQTLGEDHAENILHETQTLINGQDSNNAQWDLKTEKKGGKKSNALPGFKPGTIHLEKVGKKRKKKKGKEMHYRDSNV